MFLDTDFNSYSTVLNNIHQIFVEAAMKMYRYAKCLPRGKQPSLKTLIRQYPHSDLHLPSQDPFRWKFNWDTCILID